MAESVDVVIAAYDGAATIERCVRSVVGSTGVHACPIVVDNRSNDTSSAIARAAGARVISLERNGGYGAACNVGLERSESPWIAFMNQDVEFPPDVLHALVNAASDWERRIGRPVVVGPRLVGPNGDTAETCHRLPTLLREVTSFLAGEAAGRIRNRSTADCQQLCGWVSAALILGRSDTFRLVGGFDPRYFMYVEDVDLFSRLADAGVGCVWVPEVSVTHHGGRRPLPPAMHAYALRNWSLYFRTRQGRAAGAVVLATGVVGSVARSLVWLARGATGDPAALRYARMFGAGAVESLRSPSPRPSG